MTDKLHLALSDAAENLKAVTDRYAKGVKGYGPSSVKLAYEKFQRRYEDLIQPLLDVQAKMKVLVETHGPVIGSLDVPGYPKGYEIVPKEQTEEHNYGCDCHLCRIHPKL